MPGHTGADREQAEFQTDHEGIETEHHQRKPEQDLARVGQPPAQHQVLEKKDGDNDRKYIPDHAGKIEQHRQQNGSLIGGSIVYQGWHRGRIGGNTGIDKNPVKLNGNHGNHHREGNQSEAVQQGVSTPNGSRETNAQGGNQGNGDDVGGHAT